MGHAGNVVAMNFTLQRLSLDGARARLQHAPYETSTSVPVVPRTLAHETMSPSNVTLATTREHPVPLSSYLPEKRSFDALVAFKLLAEGNIVQLSLLSEKPLVLQRLLRRTSLWHGGPR